MNKADVAELVDARDLKSLDGNVVWVRVPPPAPRTSRLFCLARFRFDLAEKNNLTRAVRFFDHKTQHASSR
jgi:hypothetical protein